ncbi:hypothetical protein [Modestobacter versicolor]|uniref:Mce-associated membrane protein n=1 Tax=Modestobacter versicolor TaxID=429133 RepID=A0A323VE92_9ACTN|nr:hypothetical protein [Modestobacter versicolor]MBB3678057.1 hypothetical protein [Modestobacter versicolor]PZA23057.1 hypothetical protein DMO24_01985 [Modestobacter versicolor]
MSEQDRPGDGSDERSRRPAPRPRPTPGTRPAAARPSPRPRVAGSRREREDDEPVAAPAAAPAAVAPAPAPPRASRRATAAPPEPERAGAAARRTGTRPPAPAGPAERAPRRPGRLTALVLAALCLLAAAGGGWLLWERQHPAHVDPSVFSAARSGVEALYAFDHTDAEGSVQRKLDVLTGDLREQYREDLSTGGIIDTYEQVSATTRYDVAEVGLQQVDEDQDRATVVVFGQYVVESVNSGTQEAPTGSECTVTAEGAQACTQTVQMTMTRVDGDWKISELTLLTSS